MRASATSKIAPSANLHASHAKANANANANANKPDEASPFALLLDSTAPSQAAKPAADAKQSAGQNTQPDNNTDAAQAAAQTKSTPADKPGKSDQNKSDKDDDIIAKPDRDTQNSQIPAAGPQPVDPRTLTSIPAPLPAPAAPIAAAGNNAGHMPIDPAAPTPNDARDVQIAAATAATAQASADAATAQASAAAMAAPAAAQAPAVPTQASATLVAAAPAIAQASPAPPTSQASATAAQTSVTAENADGAAAQIQMAAQTLVKADASAPVTKNETAKPPKTAADAKAVSADKTDATKIDATAPPGDVKPNAPQAANSNDTQAANPAPQPVQAANNSAAGIAAPQAPLPAAAPTITQHIQVTAQPVPNIPALAVTIAAKSQSGARQFDIRLDPPELGRVDVRLSIDATGKTSAHLSADQPQTLDLLQKDASVLTRALRDAGLDVSQDGLNFSLRQQAQDGGAGNNSRGASHAFSATATISIDATVTSAAYRGSADGHLDIRV